MAINWKIDQMDVHDNYSGKQNVVWNVHWRVTYSEGQNTAVTYGTTAVPYDDFKEFTPFDQLSESEVIQWAKTEMGSNQVTQIGQFLLDEMARLQTPAAPPMLPWG